MEGSTKDALVVRGRPVDNDKGKFSSRKSKLKSRSKSYVQSTRDVILYTIDHLMRDAEGTSNLEHRA
jgi:hypothetical protein